MIITSIRRLKSQTSHRIFLGILVCVLVLGVSFGQRPEISDFPSSRYLTYTFDSSCATYQIHCRGGTRGPCKENQLFVQSSSPSQDSEDTVECDFIKSEDCTSEKPSSEFETETRTGICVWSNVDHPCYGYPASYRLYPEDGKCYSASQPFSPACKKQNQDFYSLNDVEGTCDCTRHPTQLTQFVYWPATDECYRINTQGPCSLGEWIIRTSFANSSCVKTQCPTTGEFVLYSDGETGPSCQRLLSREPCKGSNPRVVLQRVQIFPEKFRCLLLKRRLNIAKAKLRDHNCDAVSMLSLSGRCKRIFRN